jgi:hypothetical protein
MQRIFNEETTRSVLLHAYTNHLYGKKKEGSVVYSTKSVDVELRINGRVMKGGGIYGHKDVR